MSDLPFDLRALSIFLAVCDAGGMAAGARLLGITQPAVSQAVGEIEARAGVRLFDRGVRPLGLTAAGLALRERAAALLDEARQTATALREAEAGRLRLLRIGLVDSLFRALVGPLSSHLAETAEQVVVLSGLTAGHARALATRQIDLFIGVEDGLEHEGFDRVPIAAEPYRLLAPRGVTRVADLAQLGPFVRFSARSQTGAAVERHLRRLRVEPAAGQAYDTPHGVVAATMACGGWAVVTPLCVHEAAVAGAVLRRLPGPGFARRMALVSRARELGRAGREIAEVCRAAIGALGLAGVDVPGSSAQPV